MKLVTRDQFEPSYSVSSSDGYSLQIPNKEIYEEYKRQEILFKLRIYKRIRDEYGIWASNQNKFVKNIEDLNEWDSRVMENKLEELNEG